MVNPVEYPSRWVPADGCVAAGTSSLGPAMHRPTIETNELPAVFSGPKRLPEENKSKIILVVDDDPDTVDLVSSIGRKAGYMVLGATSGEECLSMLFRVTPQLILLD